MRETFEILSEVSYLKKVTAREHSIRWKQKKCEPRWLPPTKSLIKTYSQTNIVPFYWGIQENEIKSCTHFLNLFIEILKFFITFNQLLAALFVYSNKSNQTAKCCAFCSCRLIYLLFNTLNKKYTFVYFWCLYFIIVPIPTFLFSLNL